MGLFGRIIKGSSGQEGIVDNKAIDKPRPVELNSNSGKVQNTIKEIDQISNFLELDIKKIRHIIKNIFPEYKNQN